MAFFFVVQTSCFLGRRRQASCFLAGQASFLAGQTSCFLAGQASFLAGQTSCFLAGQTSCFLAGCLLRGQTSCFLAGRLLAGRLLFDPLSLSLVSSCFRFGSILSGQLAFFFVVQRWSSCKSPRDPAVARATEQDGRAAERRQDERERQD